MHIKNSVQIRRKIMIDEAKTTTTFSKRQPQTLNTLLTNGQPKPFFLVNWKYIKQSEMRHNIIVNYSNFLRNSSTFGSQGITRIS